VMQTIVARTLVKLGHNPQLVRTVDDVKPAIAAPTPAKM
jgi:hypothetical protein